MNPEITTTDRIVDRLARDTRLDALADAVQPAVDAAFTGDGPLQKLLSNVFHGTWLGHPLHPLLTDIPIGAWTVGAAADVLALGGDERAAYAGDVATTIGVAGAVAAAWAGWAEWSDTKDEPRRLGIAHAALNGAALSCYLVSLGLRKSKQRGAATAASLIGYALAAGGGYVGGELAFGLQLGARHTTAPLEPPKDFIRVCSVDDVPHDGMLRVEANGIPMLLARTGEVIRAVSAVCTHRGAPLDEGKREGDCVRCPWHGSRFSFDGSVVEGPATFPLDPFETRVTGDAVEVRAPATAGFR
jgi:nitrite reductase/ring-hydroxylating ferredoxin subunit/uncharacterized membrane protein